MIRPKGLGRGLDALLAGADTPEANDALQTIAIDRCSPASISRARRWTTPRSRSSPRRSASTA